MPKRLNNKISSTTVAVRLPVADVLPSPSTPGTDRILEDFVRMAAVVCRSRYAAICLTEGKHLACKASHGFDGVVPDFAALRGARSSDPSEFPDLIEYPSFPRCESGSNVPPIQFCASVPLLSAEQQLFGLLVVMDAESRHLTEDVVWSLKAIARQVAGQVEQQNLLLEKSSALDVLQRGEQLRESVLEKYRALMECMADGLFVARDEALLFSNRTLASMLGYEPERLLDQGVGLFVEPESQDVWLQHCFRGQSGDAAGYAPVQVSLRCYNGDRLWAELRVRPIVYDGSSAVFGVVRNITEQRLAEEALRESESRFRALADHAPVLVWMAREDQTFSYVSQPWLKYTGRSLEQEHADGWKAGVHPEDLQATLAAYSGAFDARQSFEVEFRLRRWDGVYGWMLCRGVPRLRPDGEFLGYIGTCIEITERKEAESELRISHEKLRALLRRLDAAVEAERVRISREIHDELGQSLTGLNFDLAGIRADLDPLLCGAASGVTVRERLERMGAIVDQTIGQMRRIATELRPPLLDQLGLVAALSSYISQYRHRSGIHCDLNVDPHVVLTSERAVAVFRIAQEALTNVSRHSGATQVNFSLTELNGLVTMEIRDNGSGIPVRRLLAPNSIGIVGMQERARALGGKLTIEGRAGQGTTLRLQLDAGRPTQASSRGHQRFLIVDDHPIVRRGIKQILSEAFPTADLYDAADAAGLFEQVRTLDLNLVILDLSLPDKNGLECVPEIHQLRPDLPVLILSMFSDTQFALPALKAGTSGYVNKERAPQELVIAVRKILSGGKHVNTDFAEGVLHSLINGSTLPAADHRLPHDRLSAREIQVMRGITGGKTISQIGKEMGVSVKTASTYRSRILEKLGLRANTEIVQYCLEHGFGAEQR